MPDFQGRKLGESIAQKRLNGGFLQKIPENRPLVMSLLERLKRLIWLFQGHFPVVRLVGTFVKL